MNRKTVVGLVVAATTVAGTAGQGQGVARDADAIRKLLGEYEQSLNAGSVDRVVKLYAPDGVLMPADVPVQAGAPTIRQYFERLFGETSWNLTFTPVEVTISEDWGFLRTNITGTRTPKASGKPDRLDNKALLILQRSADGSWRIARYIFNRNAPLGGPQ